MNYLIGEILLDKGFETFTKISGETAPKRLSQLNSINIFVGPNNSGKSRFLRLLASIDRYKFIPPRSEASAENPLETLRRTRESIGGQIRGVLNPKRITDADRILESLAKIADFTHLVEGQDFVSPFKGYLEMLGNKTPFETISSNGMGARPADASPSIRQIGNDCLRDTKDAFPQLAGVPEFHRIYFPTLRGLRVMASPDEYEQRTKKDYFVGAFAGLEVFTGQNLYSQVKDLLLGNLNDREVISQFQEFLSSEFFEKRPVALIPKEKTKTLDIKIGDEKERPIHELGDGIQSIIVLTFPLFRDREKRVIAFIEEPELFLHPGLQRVLLNAFHRFSGHQFFLTTHSNHFLDITLDVPDVSVFTFHKRLEQVESRERNAEFEIENVSSSDRRTLELLGVRNSSVLLSNCTIWVEGITDRRYLAHYLSLYQKHLTETKDAKARPSAFKEDLHYSFVEYSGGNITHWSFLDAIDDPINADRLCGRLFLVTDFDSEKKQERHEKLKSTLKDRYACLECREIENLLSPEVLKSVVASYEGTSDDLNDVVYESYKLKPLGEFIEAELLNAPRKRNGTYQANSGTITDKIGFCQKAIGAVASWDKVSGPAQELTKRIYDFIAALNQ